MSWAFTISVYFVDVSVVCCILFYFILLFFCSLVRLKGLKSRSLCMCVFWPNQKFQTRFILATQKSFIQFANQFYVA